MAGPIVTIYCAGPESKRHKRYVVAQYQKYRVGGSPAWFPLERWNDQGHSGRTRTTQFYLIGDKSFEKVPDAAIVDRNDVRLQLRFHCPKCRLKWERNTDTLTDPVASVFGVLDGLAADNEAVGVSLREFVALADN